MLIALLASILYSSVLSTENEQTTTHNSTDDQPKLSEEEVKNQSENENDIKPPKILSYSEFVGVVYPKKQLTEEQLDQLYQFDQEKITKVKEFFTDKRVKLSKEKYGDLLIKLLDHTEYDQEIDQDEKDLEIERIRKYVTTYLKPKELLEKEEEEMGKNSEREDIEVVENKGDKVKYTLTDLWEDWITERLYYYIEYKFPETSKNLKEDQKEEREDYEDL